MHKFELFYRYVARTRALAAQLKPCCATRLARLCSCSLLQLQQSTGRKLETVRSTAVLLLSFHLLHAHVVCALVVGAAFTVNSVLSQAKCYLGSQMQALAGFSCMKSRWTAYLPNPGIGNNGLNAASVLLSGPPHGGDRSTASAASIGASSNTSPCRNVTF